MSCTFRHARGFAEGGKLRKLRVSPRRRRVQRADTLGNQTDIVPQFRVLPLEHQMQRLEHRTGHVPVEVVCFQVGRIAVGKQTRQALDDFYAVPFLDGKFCGHCASFFWGE